MSRTYEPIATTTLSSTASSVTFNSLGTYTDIVIITKAKVSTGTAGLRLRFNGDTATNYSQTEIYGDGSSAGSARNSNQTSAKLTDAISMNTTDDFMARVNIFNYGNSTTNKTLLCRGDIASIGTEFVVALWRKTPEAITSIELFPTASTFASGSIFTLYGIKAE